MVADLPLLKLAPPSGGALQLQYKREFIGFTKIRFTSLSETVAGKFNDNSSCAGIFKQSMEARNRVGIGLSYRPARLHRLAELIPWNRFRGSLKVKKFRLCFIPYPGGKGVPPGVLGQDRRLNRLQLVQL